MRIIDRRVCAYLFYYYYIYSAEEGVISKQVSKNISIAHAHKTNVTVRCAAVYRKRKFSVHA